MEDDIQYCNTFAEAQQAAYEEAMATRGSVILGSLYQQGGRRMISTSLAMHEVIRLARTDLTRNRPLISEHVKSISEYLISEEHYILPPVTLNIDKSLKCFTTRTKSPVKNVVVIVPRGYQFSVTDGQHRIKAIERAIEVKPELQDDAISITFVLEEEIIKIHQDFADCAQTKELPKSMLTAYDTRSKLYPLIQLIKNIQIFRGRIDEMAQSIGKTSIKLFTLNQIRFCAAEILIGSSIQSRDALARNVAERLDGPAGDHHVQNIIDFYEQFTTHNSVWKLIADSNAKPGIAENTIPKLREENVHLTATGLQVISRIGHYINMKEGRQREELIQKLGNLDFTRRSDLWLDNIVTRETLKMNTTNFPVKQAVRNVKAAIGLELTDTEKALGRKEANLSENNEAMPSLF